MRELSEAVQVLPAGPPLTEEQQIGRSSVRDSLHERLLGGLVVLLMEPRRVGKTSLARAALSRIAADGGIVGELQLTSYADPQLAATELARQLAAGLGRVIDPSRRVLDRVRALGASADAGREVSLLSGLATALLGEPRDLPALLGHCSEHLPPGRHGAVLLDEAHAIANWPKPLQEALSGQLRANTRLGIVIASSETRALAQLFGPRGVLQFAGHRLEVPPITVEDWCSGLRERFVQLGLDPPRDLLARLVDLSGGHPYRTMRLALETAIVAGSLPSAAGRVPVGDGDLDAALLAVRSDPSWEALG